MGQVAIQQQEIELRRGPDIIIATPGRIIDICKNSRDFTLDDIEF